MDDVSPAAHYRAERETHSGQPQSQGGQSAFADTEKSFGPEGTEKVEPFNLAHYERQQPQHQQQHQQPPYQGYDGNGQGAPLERQMQGLNVSHPGGPERANSGAVNYGHENSDVLEHGKKMGEGTSMPPKPSDHPSLARPMEPWLQFMCSPLLSYYTVLNGVWYGAVMVVTFDNGSIYSPLPSVQINANPSQAAFNTGRFSSSPAPQSWSVQGHTIHQYSGPQGVSSFWRFFLEIPMQDFEQSITYSLNRGGEMRFLVPAAGENFRWAAHSCNGFSAGVDVDSFKGHGFESGFDPVWVDLLDKHEEIGLHAIVGGGDQLYCDSIVREPELQDWVHEGNKDKKMRMPLTPEIEFAVDRYYFSHYCKMFRAGAFGRANCSIPMMNMLDDHDLIDGFGSYEDDSMRAAIFNHIGSRGYFWYLLFQVFTVDAVDGTHHAFGQHPIKSMVIGNKGAFIPYPNHSQINYMGPSVQMCMLDCRAERKLDQINTEETYDKVFSLLYTLPASTEQLIMLLGVPIVYPRMSIAENVLSSKLNPINWAAKLAPGAVGGYTNKFDQNVELLDDLSDHWCAKPHKKERNALIIRLQELALKERFRVTFLSGDVHAGAVGELHTLYHKQSHMVERTKDHRLMFNVVSSAIVNTPPPLPAITLSNTFASHKHRTLHYADTDEVQIPLFETDTDGSARKRLQYVINRRNYAMFTFNHSNHDLNIDLMVEMSQGEGKTKAYRVIAPPPRW